MVIAVTGATGALGSLVVAHLLETLEPADVVAVARDAEKAAPLAERGVDVRLADYTDRNALESALAGVDAVLLVSGSEVGQRFAQHQNVIDAAKAAGVARVVYTSAPRATTSSLALAPEHKATEEYLVASGVDYTIVRNNWYTENYAANIATARETGTLVAAAGQGRVPSASRQDFAEGAVAVLLGDGHGKATYEFAGDVAWTYDDLAVALGDVVGREVAYRSVDAPTLVGILTGAGLDEGTAQFVAGLDQSIAEGALDVGSDDLSRLIGRPTTPLVDALRTLA